MASIFSPGFAVPPTSNWTPPISPRWRLPTSSLAQSFLSSRIEAGMPNAFICDAIRTPIGRLNGSLSSVRADDLAAVPIAELVRRNPTIDWGAVDDAILGCANQAGEDNRNVARMASLLAGLPADVPGTTINRLCGSGLNAVGIAAQAIRSGDAALVIAGGVE